MTKILNLGFLAIILCLTTTFTNAFPGKFPTSFPGEVDQIGTLPGVDFPISYRHYAGYLDSIEQTKLFYWFYESQSATPEKDPIVLWLTGGPGCSSLFGAFLEIGPIRAHVNGSFIANPYSWTQNANILFLESPVNTGFSYQSSNGSNRFVNNDPNTVKLNVGALRSFFGKFPHLENNLFYITGESYAGRYIPQLGVQLLGK